MTSLKWKYFLRYWTFMRGIHRSSVNSPHKGQWRGALMISLICARINGWVSNREAGDLGRHRAHYDVTVMIFLIALWVYISLFNNVAPISNQCKISTTRMRLAVRIEQKLQTVKIKKIIEQYITSNYNDTKNYCIDKCMRENFSVNFVSVLVTNAASLGAINTSNIWHACWNIVLLISCCGLLVIWNIEKMTILGSKRPISLREYFRRIV